MVICLSNDRWGVSLDILVSNLVLPETVETSSSDLPVYDGTRKVDASDRIVVTGVHTYV